MSTDRLAAVRDLLDLGWPGLAKLIERAQSLGSDWHALSRPFVRWDGDLAIAHAGVISVPTFLGGSQVTVGGIHAVITRPEYRMQGHSRSVMEEALAWCDERFETVVLFANEPDLYRRYGFSYVAQHAFEISRIEPRGSRSLRPLTDSADDLALIRRLAEERAPVSKVYGPVGSPDLLIINTLLRRDGLAQLHYAEDLDCIAAFEVQGGRVMMYDLIAAVVPPVTTILERIGKRVRPSLFFTPDSVDDVRRHGIQDPPDWFMVRGRWPVDGPCSVPPFSRC